KNSSERSSSNMLRELRAIVKMFFSGRRYKPTVLMYHSVGAATAHFNVTPEAFRAQMDFLSANGFTVPPFDAVVKRAKAGETGKLAAITFDDGYRDFIPNALPVLAAKRFPATMFLITGKMGAAPFMSWAEAGDILRQPGIEAGSHTVSHPKLVY